MEELIPKKKNYHYRLWWNKNHYPIPTYWVDFFLSVNGSYVRDVLKTLEGMTFRDCLSFSDIRFSPLSLERVNKKNFNVGEPVWVVSKHVCGSITCSCGGNYTGAVDLFYPGIVISKNGAQDVYEVKDPSSEVSSIPKENLESMFPTWYTKVPTETGLVDLALHCFPENPTEYIAWLYRKDKNFLPGDIVSLMPWSSHWRGYQIYSNVEALIIQKAKKSIRRNCYNPFSLTKTRKATEYLVFLEGKKFWVDDLYLEPFVSIKNYKKPS